VTLENGIQLQLATTLPLTILAGCTQAILETENVRYAGCSRLVLWTALAHTHTSPARRCNCASKRTQMARKCACQ